MKTATRTYRLHQIFICARSGNLGSLCKLEAAEDGWLQGSLDLRYEDPEATDCMLQYLYKDDYRAPEPQAMTVVKDEKGSNMRQPIEAPLLHVKVYRLGEKYGLRSLQLSALDKFRASSSDLWHTEGFLEATREVYIGAKGRDKDLCNVVISVFATRKEALLRKGGVSDLLLEAPALALHLLKFPHPWR